MHARSKTTGERVPEPLAIDIEGASFHYGARLVLDNITLRVRAGQMVALTGGNGSGKSTLLLLACGLLHPDAGTVRIFDAATTDDGGFEARRHCGFVFQNPDDQLVASVVRNEVAFGPENLGLPPDEIAQRVTWALSVVGLGGFEDRQTHSLSGGQKQRLALAGALAMRPRVLLLDEPTSMLDPESRYDFMRLIRQLADGGMTIMMATHSPREAALADRVVRLDGGTIAFAGNPIEAELGLSEDLTRIAAKDPTREPEDDPTPPRGRHARPAPQLTPEEILNAQAIDPIQGHALMPILRFDDVTYIYDNGTDAAIRALENVSLTIQLGEFIGIIGSTGSGKSTLIQHMNGLLHPTYGRVLSNWNDLADRFAANEARFRIGVVFQYPEQQLFAQTVYDDIAFGPRNQGLGVDEVEARVKEAMAQVGLDYDELAPRNPFQLSGGQQRRAAIAGVLAMHPEVLVLDEPCAGLDPAAHAAMRDLLRQLHEGGQTIIMVSHDLEDVADLATRTIQIDTGRALPA